MKTSFFMSKKTPLIACVLTDKDVLSIRANSINMADIIELRIDMFDNISPGHVMEMLRTAKDKFNKPLITTVRDISEGGQRDIPDRFALYAAAAPLSDLVDVEVNSESLLQRVKGIMNDRTFLIGSYHNFDLTPQDDFLDGIVMRGKMLGSDMVKVAVTATDRDDLIRLLLFTLRHKDTGMITMCMGEQGSPSRIIAPVFGSVIAYGYINKPSAPGQLSVMQLSEIFSLLNIR